MGRFVSVAVLCLSSALYAAPEKHVRFIAVGDTGNGNEGQWQVASAMAELCKKRGCDFVLLLGDNVYENGVSSDNDPELTRKFEEPYAGLDVPFYVALGNHDYGKGGNGRDVSRALHEVAYTQHSKKWKMPARSYHFAQGPAEFFALDTTAILFGIDDPPAAQVGEWLAASTKPWKIAFGHHPYLSNGRHGDAGNFDGLAEMPIANGSKVKAALEADVCGKADLYICGHDHNRQWLTERCGDRTELIVSGGGSSISPHLEGKHPERFSATTLGFLYVDATSHALRAEFIALDGHTEFTRTLTR